MACCTTPSPALYDDDDHKKVRMYNTNGVAYKEIKGKDEFEGEI